LKRYPFTSWDDQLGARKMVEQNQRPVHGQALVGTGEGQNAVRIRDDNILSERCDRKRAGGRVERALAGGGDRFGRQRLQSAAALQTRGHSWSYAFASGTGALYRVEELGTNMKGRAAVTTARPVLPHQIGRGCRRSPEQGERRQKERLVSDEDARSHNKDRVWICMMIGTLAYPMVRW